MVLLQEKPKATWIMKGGGSIQVIKGLKVNKAVEHVARNSHHKLPDLFGLKL